MRLKKIGSVPLKTWVTISGIFDFETKTFDVYVGGKIIKSGVRFHRNINSADMWITGWIGGAEGKQYSGTMYADNFKAYEGDKLRKITEADKNYSFNTMSYGYEFLKSAVAFNTASDKIYSYGNVTDIDGDVIISDNKFYASVYTISKTLNVSVSVKGGQITVNENKAYDVLILNESYYISLSEVSNIAGKNYVCDPNRNFCAVSDKKISYDSQAFLDAADITLYDFMTQTQIKNAFLKNAAVHPRVLINSDNVSQMKNYYLYDDEFKEWASYILSKSNDILKEDTVKYVKDEKTNQMLSQ